MKVPARLSQGLGGLIALTLLFSSGSASAALIHDIFLRDELAGFIEFSTENHTDVGAAITGFEINYTNASADLSHVVQNLATWSIDPNTWVLTDGLVWLADLPCAQGGTLRRNDFRFSSPGAVDSASVIGPQSCNPGSIFNETLNLTFAPREMTALPEPSALLLFGAGLAGMAVWRRRTKHSDQA